MSDLWRSAGEASKRFVAQARAYDRYRPRYPDSVFDDIIGMGTLPGGAKTVEIGAGTGIATEPLVDRGLDVVALEPGAGMAAIAESKVAGRCRIVVERFEDFSFDSSLDSSVELLAAFNAWHWVDPGVSVDLAARLLRPGGSLALVWTEVVSWGPEPFEERLASTFGSPWEKRMDHVDDSMQPVRADGRFDEFRDRHHRFERTLDGATFVAVTRTYGGHRTADQYHAIERIIDDEFGGRITKVEDAVLYLATRLSSDVADPAFRP